MQLQKVIKNVFLHTRKQLQILSNKIMKNRKITLLFSNNIKFRKLLYIAKITHKNKFAANISVGNIKSD